MTETTKSAIGECGTTKVRITVSDRGEGGIFFTGRRWTDRNEDDFRAEIARIGIALPIGRIEIDVFGWTFASGTWSLMHAIRVACESIGAHAEVA